MAQLQSLDCSPVVATYFIRMNLDEMGSYNNPFSSGEGTFARHLKEISPTNYD